MYIIQSSLKFTCAQHIAPYMTDVRYNILIYAMYKNHRERLHPTQILCGAQIAQIFSGCNGHKPIWYITENSTYIHWQHVIKIRDYTKQLPLTKNWQCVYKMIWMNLLSLHELTFILLSAITLCQWLNFAGAKIKRNNGEVWWTLHEETCFIQGSDPGHSH